MSDDLICVSWTVEFAVEVVCLIVQWKNNKHLLQSDQLIVLYNPTILASLTYNNVSLINEFISLFFVKIKRNLKIIKDETSNY